jgi:hypothetical protein
LESDQSQKVFCPAESKVLLLEAEGETQTSAKRAGILKIEYPVK